MSNLLASLGVSASTLDAFQSVVAVSQNNVANASTPGYAAQTLDLSALPMDIASGLLGGVTAGNIESSRQVYVEQAVRNQQQTLGDAGQQAVSLALIQPTFDISGKTGVSGALNQLFSSFSAWGVTPADTTARQGVLSAAQFVAQSFNQAASDLGTAGTTASSQIQSVVGQINSLAATIQSLNVERHQDGANPNADAKLNDTLEQLSKLVNFTTLQQPDGSVTVLLGGQTPLVIGSQINPVGSSSAFAGTPTVAGGIPNAQILNSQGQDITSQITGGQLGGLLAFRNQTLPALLGNGQQQGSLSALAQGLADRVNQLLTNGQTASGQNGLPLFSYNPLGGDTVAGSLTVNPNISTSTLAAVAPGPPVVSNGVALSLAGLANPSTPADEIQGLSYVSYFGRIAASIGGQLANATENQNTGSRLVAQAQAIRSQLSGVSLDQEAARLVEFQRAYDATSRLVTVLDQMSQSLINMIPLA